MKNKWSLFILPYCESLFPNLFLKESTINSFILFAFFQDFFFTIILGETYPVPISYVHVCVNALQSCPTVCNPIDCSLPGSSVHGISRQKYWSELPCPPPGVFLTQGSNPCFLSLLHWQVGFFTISTTWEDTPTSLCCCTLSRFCRV